MESEVVGYVGYRGDGVFFYGQPSFIITDNMVVQSNSTGVFLIVIKDQGYADVEKLSESFLVIGSEEVFYFKVFFFNVIMHILTLHLNNN